MELTREEVHALLPARPAEGHKGDFGHCFVLAGSRGFTGAAKLACEAAGRSGAALVTLGVPDSLGDALAAALTESMSLLLPATLAESFSERALEPALRFAAKVQAVVLGPGLSRHPETVRFAQAFAAQCPIPLVVDADGLNALSETPAVMTAIHAPCILTPHPGEMARLMGSTAQSIQDDRESNARRLADKTKFVVVLKGHRTVIAGPDGSVAVNPTGNHGLAKGGTGDVLAGLLGGLLAQGMTPFPAACLGVYLHGLAGDIAAERYTARGMTASDVIHALPDAWRIIEG
jgi:ADP-dependent NAD(P)H-hydrate dehydratase / NAD(P)H-hydrate epimerase